jgi:hypothetical protein
MTYSHRRLDSGAIRRKPALRRRSRRLLQMVGIVALLLQLSPATSATAGETSGATSNGLSISNVQSQPAETVERFDKLEITFHIANSVATAIQWPYDPAPPNGIPAGVGISVHAVFTDPDGRQFVQPAFPYQHFLDETRNGRDWHLPTGSVSWKVRFSPNKIGAWSYRLRAQDASGATETPSGTRLRWPLLRAKGSSRSAQPILGTSNSMTGRCLRAGGFSYGRISTIQLQRVVLTTQRSVILESISFGSGLVRFLDRRGTPISAAETCTGGICRGPA